MIIESAFLKLPELLSSSFDYSNTYEATVVHHLAHAVLMELGSRGIQGAFDHIYTEQPYPTKFTRAQPIKADLFVKLDVTDLMKEYGLRERNWIEAKAFLGYQRGRSKPPKTANAGKILHDLLRLCLLPEELQGSHRWNGRYFLLICDRPISEYVAFTDLKQKRNWVLQLLSEREEGIHVDLSAEPKSLREAVGSGFIKSPDLKMDLKFRTLTFRPQKPEGSRSISGYLGYLMRIIYFKIDVSGHEIEYEDKPGHRWGPDRINNLEEVRSIIIDRMTGFRKTPEKS